jgi:hypothetical protein
MNSDEYKEMAESEEKFLAEHWANDLLDSPHALIAAIETKIARAVIARENEIVEMLEDFYDGNLWRQVGFNPDVYEGFNMEEIIARVKAGPEEKGKDSGQREE